MSVCKECGEPIVWSQLPDDKMIALDPGPAVYELVDGIAVRKSEWFMASHLSTCTGSK